MLHQAYLNLGYFNEKCVASEVGRSFRLWDSCRAMSEVRYQLEDEVYKANVGLLESATVNEFEWSRFLDRSDSTPRTLES